MRARFGIVVAGVLIVSTAWSGPTAQPQLTVFFGNLHSHTALSDGSGTPAEAYEHARDVAGIDFLAVTEHNHAQAGDIAGNPALYTGPGSLALIPTANRFTEEDHFIALYGQEFSTISGGNHVNVLDAPRVIDVPNGAFRQLLEDWLPMNLDTQGQEPIVLLNHPTTSDSPQSLEYGIDDYDGDTAPWLVAVDPRAPLINLINGPSHTDGTGLPPGKPSESELRRYLTLGLHVAPTADQDNHKRNWGNATHARTAVLAPRLTKAALLSALRARRVYATEDRNLRLIYRVNTRLLGSRITGSHVPPVGTALTLSLDILDEDEATASYTVEVFSDRIGGTDEATVVRTQSVAGNGIHTITGVTYQGGDQYVFLRIRQSDGNRAWTAPVWFEPLGGGGTSGPPISLSLVVDEVAETALITNTGSGLIDFTGWRLISVRGNQVFDQFPPGFTLNPGEHVTVTSGPSAKTGAGFLQWTTQNIWSNSGDPGRLIDRDGQVVVDTGR